MENLSTIWDQMRSTQPTPSLWVVAATAVLAAILVAAPRAWPVTRNVVTIAHEGGHALVAALVGRRLAGIQLHSDTSGVTVSSGKPHGFGMVLTAAAGYTAPSLLGLGAAALLSRGKILTLLWLATLLLAVMFILIRNIYGAFTVALTGGALFAISWWTPSVVQGAFALLLMWVMLLAGPRPVWELQSKRRAGQAPESDADQLAALTGIPGLLWVGLFGAVTIASLVLAVMWMAVL